jgi:hypothetical protein
MQFCFLLHVDCIKAVRSLLDHMELRTDLSMIDGVHGMKAAAACMMLHIQISPCIIALDQYHALHQVNDSCMHVNIWAAHPGP